MPVRPVRPRVRSRSGRHRASRRMLDARTMLWLSRRLWRPVAAELLRARGRRTARRRAITRMRAVHRPAARRAGWR
jgi:hypothetical protein